MGKSLSAVASGRAWQVDRGCCGRILAGNSGKSLPLHGVLAVKIMPNFGALRENEAAFDVALAAIARGESAWGYSILVALRDHICSTGEQKSVQWLLPQVLEILAARKRCPPSPPAPAQ
jgi:hypothetical protein